jgi:hypothetical protein
MAIFIGSKVLIKTISNNKQYLTTACSDKLRGAEVEIIDDENNKITLSGHQYTLVGNVWEIAKVLGVSEN